MGETRVSRLRAMHDESWLNLEESLKTGSIVKGYITGKVRGGMTVDVAGVRAFCLVLLSIQNNLKVLIT